MTGVPEEMGYHVVYLLALALALLDLVGLMVLLVDLEDLLVLDLLDLLDVLLDLVPLILVLLDLVLLLLVLLPLLLRLRLGLGVHRVLLGLTLSPLSMLELLATLLRLRLTIMLLSPLLTLLLVHRLLRWLSRLPSRPVLPSWLVLLRKHRLVRMVCTWHLFGRFREWLMARIILTVPLYTLKLLRVLVHIRNTLIPGVLRSRPFLLDSVSLMVPPGLLMLCL